jgi:Fe-S-cluster-containing dehydrogenase component/DMSO reductase anchor subunit
LTLIDQFLAEQKELSAVERFSEQHERLGETPAGMLYRDLIPLTKPGAGQQYAFEVDLDACTGCKACVTACHRMNGLDRSEAETWRSVGLLHGGAPQAPVQQTVTTACHHCLDPACMKGCPVNAYEKHPITGIVKHLDDQCIGCQYCTLTCPYEVPQFSPKRGIVRKCDMCSGRLEAGEAPACVQACPNEAIAIRVVDRQRALEDAQGDGLLPAAPPSSLTYPTTRYLTRRALPRNLLPADFHSVRSAKQHWPLVVMLVLTQLSVGAFACDFLVRRSAMFTGLEQAMRYQALLGVATGLIALAASTLHLGRPLYAFRAVLGFRRSWLSREIVAFGAFAKLACVQAALLWWFWREAPTSGSEQLAIDVVTGSVVAFGLVGVACSVMVYHVTHRVWWTASRTGFRFFGTSAILGLAMTVAVLAAFGAVTGQPLDATATARLVQLLIATTLLKLTWETLVLVHLSERHLSELKRTALLMIGQLRPAAATRVGLALVGGVLLPLVSVSLLEGDGRAEVTAALAVLSLVLLVAGESVERALFFTAVSTPRMPGGVGQ